MPRSNYRQIAGWDGHLSKLEPFQGNTMSAFVDPDSGVYYVKSYDTVIAYANPIGRIGDGSWDYSTADVWVTETRYGTTTSRHQSLL